MLPRIHDGVEPTRDYGPEQTLESNGADSHTDTETENEPTRDNGPEQASQEAVGRGKFGEDSLPSLSDHDPFVGA